MTGRSRLRFGRVRQVLFGLRCTTGRVPSDKPRDGDGDRDRFGLHVDTRALVAHVAIDRLGVAEVLDLFGCLFEAQLFTRCEIRAILRIARRNGVASALQDRCWFARANVSAASSWRLGTLWCLSNR